jgi:hypothetical protein
MNYRKFDCGDEGRLASAGLECQNFANPHSISGTVANGM